MERKTFVPSSTIKLEKFLITRGLNFVLVKKLLRAKDVKVNGKRTKDDIFLNAGDVVECFVPEEYSPKIEIVFEDENTIIVNKPAGIESCGKDGIEGLLGVMAVHRLDKFTSGLNIFAKTDSAKLQLERVFKQKLVSKKYLCEVAGDSNFDGEEYSAYLFKDSKKAHVVVSDCKKQGFVEIKTKFKTTKHGVQTSIVECELITGKTHQIRAHLAHLGHAILGDNKYGNKVFNRFFRQNHQKLACVSLTFKKNSFESLSSISGKTFKILPPWEENND